VDIASLRGFITKCKQTIAANSKGRWYADAELRNLSAAQQLMAIVHEADASNPSSPYLRERYDTGDTGRTYGQGYSLQRMPKEVRHAALGVCHKYDFKACAFAVMASLAHAINPTLKISAVLDYIKKRAVIRKRIAAQTGIDEKLVKEIFTAMGFGAELKKNSHNAIWRALGKAARKKQDKSVWLEKEVYNKLGEGAYEILISNQTFMFIYEDLQQINKTILQKYNHNDIVIGNAVYSDIDPNWEKKKKKTNKRTKLQKLAWIYQAFETLAREQFEELAQQKALLTTHDCLYFKRKLSSEQIKTITYDLQKTYRYLQFEHEPIKPITTQEIIDERLANQVADEEAHKALIARQELAVKTYVSPNNWVQQTKKIALTDAEYEEQHKQQFIRDVGITEYNVGNTEGNDDEYEYKYDE